MLERDLQAKVLKKLRALGGFWINKSPSPWDAEGISDILGCFDGRFIAIELKAPGKYADPWKGLKDAQRRFLARVTDNGGTAICADSWETVESELRKDGIALPHAA